MSKKVLILSASPREEGNSEILCKQFLSGVESANKEGEIINLRNMSLHYCKACEFCARNSGKCIYQDDMAQILEEMIKADVIVMATPVYFYTMDARMKTVIDRSVARYQEIRNKSFYFIITAADDRKLALERTVEGFRGYIYCLSKAREKGVIYGTGVLNKGDIKGSYVMKQAYEMGRDI